MTTRQLIYLILIVAVVGMISAVTWKGSRKDWRDAEAAKQELFPALDINDIAKLDIADAHNSATLAMTDGQWRVRQRYGYPADFSKISDLVLKIEKLSAAQQVVAEPAQYARLELLAPDDLNDQGIGISLQFTDATDRTLASMILGKQHMRAGNNQPGMGGAWPVARYLRRLMPEPQKVVMVTETFSAVSSNPAEWLDKTFIKIDNIKTAKLTRNGTLLWELTRENQNNDLTLTNLDGETHKMQTSTVSALQNAFSWSRFDDIADPQLPAETTGLAQPAVFQALSFDGTLTTLKIGNKNPDGKYYLAAELQFAGTTEREPADDEAEEEKKTKDDEFTNNLRETRQKINELNEKLAGWVYLVGSYNIDNVLKARQDFIKPPEPAKPEETPAD